VIGTCLVRIAAETETLEVHLVRRMWREIGHFLNGHLVDARAEPRGDKGEQIARESGVNAGTEQ